MSKLKVNEKLNSAVSEKIQEIQSEIRQIERLIVQSRNETQSILDEIARLSYSYNSKKHSVDVDMKYSQMGDQVRIRDGLQLLKEQHIARINVVSRQGVSA